MKSPACNPGFFILLLATTFLSLNGCALVLEGAVNGLVSAAIDPGKSAEKTEPKPENPTLIRLAGGDSVVLKDFQIAGDTLIGKTEDYSEVRIPTQAVIGVERTMNGKDRTKGLQAARQAGLFAACMSAGMLIGAGAGYAIPLTERSGSSISGADQFTSMMFGMAIGASIGIVFYMILFRDEK